MLSFWSHAGSWMLRVSLLVALFKLGGTLIWASVAGYGVTLDFWFGFVPHFDFEIAQDRFVRLVTLSTWLGIIGAGAGLLCVFVVSYRVNARHVAHRQRLVDAGAVADGEIVDEDASDDAIADAAEIGRIGPSVDELLTFDRFTERVSQAGLWLGAWIGSMTVIATIGFEMFRHFYIDAYIWQAQHVVATLVAAIPVLAILAMVFMGRFRAALPIVDVETLLTASGFEVVDPDELDDELGARTDTDDATVTTIATASGS